MPRPGVGNPGNKGNKHAKGQPSRKEREWHLNKWEQDSLVDQLEAKVASKKYSIRDIWLLRALKGSEPILKQAADKVLADLHDHRGKDGAALKLEGFIYSPPKGEEMN